MSRALSGTLHISVVRVCLESGPWCMDHTLSLRLTHTLFLFHFTPALPVSLTHSFCVTHSHSRVYTCKLASEEQVKSVSETERVWINVKSTSGISDEHERD